MLLLKSSWLRMLEYGSAAAGLLRPPKGDAPVHLWRLGTGAIILARLVSPYSNVETDGEKSSTRSISSRPTDLDRLTNRLSPLPSPVWEGLTAPRLIALSTSLNEVRSSQIPAEAAAVMWAVG